jgi:transcriptional regulator with XRE-family HTH domain
MIPLQISAIMRARRINQKQLAEASGLTQGAISRAANPNYGNLTVNTIIRVAAGLDVAFIGLFVPFSRLESFFRNLSEDGLADVATFSEEDAQRDEDTTAPPATAPQQIVKGNTAESLRFTRLPLLQKPKMLKADHNPNEDTFRAVGEACHG